MSRLTDKAQKLRDYIAQTAEELEVTEWRQPAGKADSYMLGDVVTYKGKKYVSTMDTNEWMPGTIAWEIFEK